MINRVILSFCLLIAVTSCKKDLLLEDFREPYVGTYDCKKSSSSFDDPVAVDVEVLIEKDSLDDTLIIINGKKVPINADGIYGPDIYESQYFSLKIEENSLELYTYAIVPGLAIHCYIYGEKN